MARKGNMSAGKKRSAASRDEKPVVEKKEVFPQASVLEASSESEYESNDDEEDIMDGDFDQALRAMAEDQGFDSADGEDFESEDAEEAQEAENDDNEDDDEESDIHSSDIEGASSDGEDADSEDAESDDEEFELERTGSRSTDGHATAFDSDAEAAAYAEALGNADSELLGDEGMDRLTIRDFGKDLESWKSYRKTLPQIEPGYASDSSTDEPVNTIGNVPIEWYEDYPHIGYDIDGKRIMKPATADELDKFLENMDNPDVFRTARDEVNQKDVKISAEEIDIIRRIQGGDIPDADYNPYEDTVEWFTSQTMKTPLTGAPLTKRGFVPSKWEHKRVMQIVRAIRQGLITSGAPTEKQEPRLYDVWENADAQPKEDNSRRPRLVAPRMALPTHEESYHPPEEYLATPEEREKWENTDPEDRKRNFLPQDFNSLRTVPGYENFVHERFQRCLDLYLAPRMLKKTNNLNAEELMPRLPDPRDLRPFPSAEALVYLGHTGRVRSISVDPTGLWLLSGSDDGTVRLWELVTGRCARIWNLGDVVHTVAWCPNAEVCVFAVAAGSRVAIIIPTELCDDQKRLVSEELVRAGFSSAAADEDVADDSLPVSWDTPTTAEQATGMHIMVAMHKTVKSVAWHRRGDYLASLTSEEGGSSVLIHQISKH
ncbi:Ribosome biogenesis protein erb1, partial [Kickxella alabastrina]